MPSSRDFGDGFDDVRIGAATTDVAAHALADLGGRDFGRCRKIRGHMAWYIGLDFLEHGNGGTDLAGGAVAALEPVVLDKGGLHRMEVFGLPQSFERGDAVALVHDGKRQARVDAAAFNENRARSALTVVAPLLGTRQMQKLAQRVEKRRSVVELKLPAFAVHRKSDLRALGCGGGFGLRVTERVCAHHCHGSGRGGEQVAPRDFKCARTLHIQLHVLMMKGLERDEEKCAVFHPHPALTSWYRSSSCF
jgi:hypothetical protein